MAFLFFLMVSASVAYMFFANPSGVLTAALGASANGVQLAITLCGIYIVWQGIVQIAVDAGLVAKLARLLAPAIRFLFGKQTPEVNNLIATNISANMIGAGGAATPAGISAIEKMNTRDHKSATTPMIMLFVLSATSLQIIPTTVIGILEKYGATNAAGIILPTILVSVTSTVVGVVLVKVFSRFKKGDPADTSAALETDTLVPQTEVAE
jgi:spore maturation protein A